MVDLSRYVDWGGRRETPAEEESPVETPAGACAEEAPGPPAESERLKRK